MSKLWLKLWTDTLTDRKLARLSPAGRWAWVGLLLLAGEAAEAMEMIKKYRFHGHDLDYPKLKKELGDTLWYLAVLADLLGFSLDGVAQANIAKLERRYPDGFSADASRNRTE